ncbi:MAG: D-aminoacyl-tRNA deacylase [Candidatus Omnitrophica bacterium]|nr:D-aminoacyl-tRNA deacylase [Candidatus Omnitrophota bacterium]
MKIIIQRVKNAAVTVDGKKVAAIGKGFLLLAGIGKEDTETIAENMALKIIKLRIFEDENGKMNLDIRQVEGEVLSVSQFTLLGDTTKGNRPGFDKAALPDKAKELWEYFNEKLYASGIPVKQGVFGAHMDVSLVNDGPVTFSLEI